MVAVAVHSSEKSPPAVLPVVSRHVSDERKSSPAAAAMSKKGVFVAISYMACAVLLVMFNKAALSSYNFPCANVITLFQMLSSTALLYALRSWKIISFTVQESQTTLTNTPLIVPFKTLVHTLPVAISYLVYMLVSMESIRGISIPMYTTLRRTTVAFTMVAEYIIVGRKHTSHIVACVGIIILGAFVAGSRDLSFDFYSYAIVFTSNITTAIYLACIARVGESSGLNSFGLMWCNGIICAPVLLIWTACNGDLGVTLEFSYFYTSGFQALMVLSCVMAFLLNYCVYLNTTINSALTQTICGNLKDFFTIGFGWLVFGGLPFDLLNVVGQCMGFLGSGLYAYCKLKGK
nr:UDP-sugar transporter sqv-7-like [Ipomoea batatas]